jgi:hypothetical protein
VFALTPPGKLVAVADALSGAVNIDPFLLLCLVGLASQRIEAVGRGSKLFRPSSLRTTGQQSATRRFESKRRRWQLQEKDHNKKGSNQKIGHERCCRHTRQAVQHRDMLSKKVVSKDRRDRKGRGAVHHPPGPPDKPIFWGAVCFEGTAGIARPSLNNLKCWTAPLEEIAREHCILFPAMEYPFMEYPSTSCYCDTCVSEDALVVSETLCRAACVSKVSSNDYLVDI